jgi:MFS family permease
VLGLVGGAAQVAIPAFADEHGAAWASGLVLAAIAAGSIAGGLRFHPPRDRYPLLLALAAAGPGVLALAPSLLVMGALGLMIGLVLAPAFAAGFSLVSRLAPAGAVTEAFAWTSTTLVVGLAVGNAMTGALVEAASPRAALAVSSAIALALAAAVALRRATLARDLLDE